MEIISIVETHALGADGVTYFKTVTTTYDDGSQDAIKRPVGPAQQIAGDTADTIRSASRALAYHAGPVSKTKQAVQQMNDNDANAFAISGISPLKLIQDGSVDDLLAPGWTIDEGAGPIPLVFTVTGQGVLKYSVNGTTTKNAVVYGSLIRFKNYPSSPTDTDFFLSESGGRYFSLPNRNVLIKKP